YKTILTRVRWRAAGGKDLSEEFYPAPNSQREIGCAAEAEILSAEFAAFGCTVLANRLRECRWLSTTDRPSPLMFMSRKARRARARSYLARWVSHSASTRFLHSGSRAKAIVRSRSIIA